MNNEEILKTRWKNIDKYLLEYLKDYLKVNRETRDQIQNVFNEMNIEYKDINKLVSKEQKNKLNRFILKLKEKGLLTGYFGYMARLIYSKKNVTYLEMLNIMIMACYIEQNDELDEYNNLLFYKACKESYEQAMKDIEKIKKINPISFKIPILYTILNIPIFNTTIESYLYSLALTNSEELIKQTLINMQLGKKLNVDNKMYTSLFDKQNKRYININEDKISGGITNIVENITNLSYLQAGKDTNTTECRFIAEMDKRTTQMCETLNNQIFKIDEMNVYQRYSDIDKKIVTYHTKGLIIGENLPPITNHFHWCRSTITYLLEENIADVVRDNIKVANNTDKEQYDRYKKYFENIITDDVEKFTKMKYNNPVKWNYLKNNYNLLKHRYNAIQDGKLSALVSPSDYLKINDEICKKIIGLKLLNDLEVKSKSYHFLDRVIGNIEEKRNGVKIEDIIKTLTNSNDIRRSYANSYKIYGENNIISINDEGNLIQVNPRGGK